jgi:hypothetical protein
METRAESERKKKKEKKTICKSNPVQSIRSWHGRLIYNDSSYSWNAAKPSKREKKKKKKAAKKQIKTPVSVQAPLHLITISNHYHDVSCCCKSWFQDLPEHPRVAGQAGPGWVTQHVGQAPRIGDDHSNSINHRLTIGNTVPTTHRQYVLFLEICGG